MIPQNWTIFRRCCLSTVLLTAIGTAAGCGNDEGGFDKPEVGVGAVESVSILFVNSLDDQIFVPWLGEYPEFTVTRDDSALVAHQSCLPQCGSECMCSSCPANHMARVVPAGESFSFEWIPMHYAVNTCNESSKCSCLETWPLTVGRYVFSMRGFTNAGEGSELDVTKNLVVDAVPSSESTFCSAEFQFNIRADGSTTAAVMSCE
ncbi:MAG: hypothetical protein FWD57_01340 [Polyangiaceae bacterium]|nr:hypothetical protein [Polyangiaceae bacterium]